MAIEHVSSNRVVGSLADVGLDRLLAACSRRQVTGTIDVAGGGRRGVIELRIGGVVSASFAGLTGDEALAVIAGLVDGSYELVQRLPDVDGSLGSAAELRAEGIALIDMMRHCEQHALSCTITALSEFEVGTVEYRAGEIVAVTLNGRRDDDAITELLRWRAARFRVAAPPLAVDIEGWPVTERARTEPFVFRAGVVDLLPLRPPRRRAPTALPPPESHESGWGELLWSCVAFAIARVGARARARHAPNPPVAAPPPTRRQRVRRRVARWADALRRTLTPWRARSNTAS